MRNEAIFDLDEFNASTLGREAYMRDGGAAAARSSFAMRLSAWLGTLIDTWRDGRRRYRDRVLLMQLSDHYLKDIGISRGAIGPAERYGRSALDRI
jgi:uncharacterized protein YjiS (DUF1127 family)